MRYLLLLLLAFSGLQADQITMKNGDRITGSIVKFDGKALTVKSEYAGELAITWDAVSAISSTQPLNLGLKDGQVVAGTVTTTDDSFTVQTANAGTVTAPRASITYIHSNDEQAVYERQKNPRLIDLWTGNLALGFAKADGNSKTTNLNISGNAARVTSRDKTTVYFTSLYASDHTTAPARTTANSERGGFNYDFNLNPRLYIFAGSDFEADQFQSLDLRFSPGGGFGYYFFKNERGFFDAFLGGTLDKEYYSNNVKRSYGEAQTGEEYTFKVSKITNLHQIMTFYPNLSATGQFRLNFDISADTKLRKWLAWQVAISDRYISNPLPGRQTNDLIVTTGVNLLLAK